MYMIHPSFKCPSDKTKIWRYMDLTKFIWMLDTKSLYFCRSDLLGDPYEYAIPQKSLNRIKEIFAAILEKNRSVRQPGLEDVDKIYRADSMAEHFDNWINFFPEEFKRNSRSTFVNCWHINKQESAAMWKLYSKSDEGVAIQSTVGRLKESLDGRTPIYIGRIKYGDYRKIELDWNDEMQFVLHKRLSFSHEREVRAVIVEPKYLDEKAESIPTGWHMGVDLTKLISNIYVNPSTTEFFRNVVQILGYKYELDKIIMRSNLYDPPE